MQGGAAAVGGVDHPRDQGRAVRSEDGLRGLDLDLEAQAGQAEFGLDLLVDVHQGFDLGHAGHLGQRGDESVEAPAGTGEGMQEPDQGPQAARPRRTLERLEPDADERGGGAALLGRRQSPYGRGDVLVLDVVAPGAVPVLEVDAQVLDGFVGQLGPHPVGHGRSDQGGEGVLVGVEGGPGLLAPGGDEVGAEAVGRNVDGVHGLTPGALARELRAQLGVRAGQPPVQLGAQAGGQPGRLVLGRCGRVAHACSQFLYRG